MSTFERLSRLSTDADATTDSAGDFPWGAAVAYGAGAFVIGYLFVLAVFVLGPATTSGTTGDRLTLIGFVFYNAHHVAVVGGGESVNLLAQATDPNVPVALYYAIPVVLLVAVGAVFGRRHRQSIPEPSAILNAGAAMAVGYAVVAVLGTFFLGLDLQAGAVLSPELGKSALFGVAYPVVFCTVGAAATFVAGR